MESSFRVHDKRAINTLVPPRIASRLS